MNGKRGAFLFTALLLSVADAAYATPFKAIAVAAGGAHTCALTDTGGVMCWGGNYAGQLGDNTFTASPLPVPVIGLSSGVSAVGSGDAFSCALTTGGAVYCWGYNGSGQLGNGQPETYAGVPVLVAGLGQGVVAIGVGQAHVCAVLADGHVSCWGFNSEGQLGNGSILDQSTPVRVIGVRDVRSLAIGYSHSCALTAERGIKCWGFNGFGEYGDGTFISSLTAKDAAMHDNVVAVASGHHHVCAINLNGGVRCWGLNLDGQLGDDSGIQAQIVPVRPVGLGQGALALAGGGAHTCVLGTGRDQCFGSNVFGQLGDGTTVDRPAPVYIEMNGKSVAISAGANHTCSLLPTGKVKCWGQNFSGQLGDGTNLDSALPVIVQN